MSACGGRLLGESLKSSPQFVSLCTTAAFLHLLTSAHLEKSNYFSSKIKVEIVLTPIGCLRKSV